MASHVANLYASFITTIVLSTIALSLRAVARHMTRIRPWWDDYCAIAAYLFSWIWHAMLLLWIQNGLGKRLADIDATQEESLRKAHLFLFISELSYAASLAFAKFAILAFYWRIFKISIIRIPIQVLFILSVVWLIIRTFVAIFHCIPVQKFWLQDIEGYCKIDDSAFFFYSVLVHLLLDVAILILPAIEVRRLNLATAQKIGITALFMFGTIVCIASIMVMHISLSFDPKSPEVNWNIAPIWVWATAELNLAVVSACLPVLRPVLLFITRFGSLNGSSNKYSLSGGATDHNKRSIKLNTFHQSRAKGETDSTYRFAREAEARSFNSDSETQAISGTHGPKISITKGDISPNVTTMPENGIIVKKETSVQISKVYGDE